MSHEGYHEPVSELTDATRDMHRAIVSLMEELEAVDWYNQRADACKDLELKKILEHNRDEEKEHAAMTLEWIRRQDPKFDGFLREFRHAYRIWPFSMMYSIRSLATKPVKPRPSARNSQKVPVLPALDSQASCAMMNTM